MAQMDRNVNLEEIDSDALFGIDALKGQTFKQKVIFFGSLALGILENIFLPRLGVPGAVCVLFFLLLILFGIAFGCNYTKDLTYGKYFYCYFFKPVKSYRYKSNEDISGIRKKAAELKREEEMVLLRKKGGSDKKTLYKLVAFALGVVILVISALVYSKAFKREAYHHEVKEESIEQKE
jgi:hypothetical protein